MTAVFGVPDYDLSTEYQRNDEAGRWQNGSAVFTYPRSRIVCWLDVLCLTFGGATPHELRFVGWTYHDAAGGVDALSTADGIAMGSSLSDHLESITVLPDSACYSSITGRTKAGIDVSLYSVGEPFASYDSTGTYIKGNPPPQDVLVDGLYSGDRVGDLAFDC